MRYKEILEVLVVIGQSLFLNILILLGLAAVLNFSHEEILVLLIVDIILYSFLMGGGYFFWTFYQEQIKGERDSIQRRRNRLFFIASIGLVILMAIFSIIIAFTFISTPMIGPAMEGAT
jgi:uncharacterized membrane protein